MSVDTDVSYHAVFVMPGEEVRIRLTNVQDAEPQFDVETGTVTGTEGSDWVWRFDDGPQDAPLLSLKLADRRFQVRAFVLTPFSPQTDDTIGDFRIGLYPPQREGADTAYAPPGHLLRVTPHNQELRVSPHFTVRQFLCKQAGGWPKYIVPSERLYAYLESLLAMLRHRGIDVDTLTVMSGYRTPSYNASLGNVRYSRHIYGDAADIFIDADDDGRMDDLDGNGIVDFNDAQLFADWIREWRLSAGNDGLPGGMGIYAANEWRGPFVHVDLRGSEANWSSRH